MLIYAHNLWQYEHWQKGFSVEHYLNVLNIALRILKHRGLNKSTSEV